MSAVLQVAGDLRLLGLCSAAPHRVDPLARWAGATGELTEAYRSVRSSVVEPTLPNRWLFPHTPWQKHARTVAQMCPSGLPTRMLTGHQDLATVPVVERHLARGPRRDAVCGQGLDRAVDVVRRDQRHHPDAAVQGGLE